jgi:hypothetical protein
MSPPAALDDWENEVNKMTNLPILKIVNPFTPPAQKKISQITRKWRFQNFLPS